MTELGTPILRKEMFSFIAYKLLPSEPPWKHQGPLPSRAEFSSVLFHLRVYQENRGTTLSFSSRFLGKSKRDFSFSTLVRIQIIFLILHVGRRRQRKQLQVKKGCGDFFQLHIETHMICTEGRTEEQRMLLVQ